MLPLVSVIIPVYNGELYLAEALESVVSQKYGSLEIIVVDDGSTDNSRQVVMSFGSGVRLVVQENQGTAAARNRGVSLATGSLLAFLDQDDVWVEGKVAKQVKTLLDSPETEAVFGQVEQFLSPELSRDLRKRLSCDSEGVPGILPSVMMIRRPAFDRVGPFETGWQLGEWANWYARSQEFGLKTTMLSNLLVRRRLHAGNKGLSLREFRREYVEVIRESILRRRAGKRDDRVPEDTQLRR